VHRRCADAYSRGDGIRRPSLEAGRQRQTRGDPGTQSHGTRTVGSDRPRESAGLPKSGGRCGHGPPAPGRAPARPRRRWARARGHCVGTSHLTRGGSGPPIHHDAPRVSTAGRHCVCRPCEPRPGADRDRQVHPIRRSGCQPPSGGAAGSWTLTRSPPSDRALRVRVPSWARVMLWTIARPSPTPAWPLRIRPVPR
jgi:hypothetical protein